MIKKATSLLLFMSMAGFLSAQSNWATIGPSFNSSVEAIVTDSSNNIYAAGSFTMAGTLSRSGIAKWNGSTWNALGSGMVTGTDVKSLGFYMGHLVATGTFTDFDSSSCNNITTWSGSRWVNFGSGLEKYTGATTVSTQIVYGGDLYVAGTFDHSGSNSLSNIAKWNGSAWVSPGTGINGNVNKLIEFNGDLYACGTFTSAGGVTVHNIAKWDGNSWSDVGGGVQKYTGATTVSTMLNFAQALYVGGDFNLAGSDSVHHLAKWDGTSWTDAGSGTDYTGATTVSTMFIGYFDNSMITCMHYQSIVGGADVYKMMVYKTTTGWNSCYTLNGPFAGTANYNGSLLLGGPFTTVGTDTIPYLAELISNNHKSLMLMADGSSYTLYPNPVDNDLWIRFNPGENADPQVELINFTLMDITGREVLQLNNINTDQMHIARNGLASGMYIYRITDKNNELIRQGKLTFK
ncbi:MAG: hypothetical protein JWP12_3518 [Bacteroidetes bacterium]|nr:hypothetical protein [Bacteroidota bacterium]